MAAVSLTDITTAISNSQVCLRVPELKNAKPLKHNGRIVSYAGNYGVVYKFILLDGTHKAVRVWTKDLQLLPDIPSRARIISLQFKQIDSPYFSSFKFYDKGILVKGNLCPLVVMDWEEGYNLKDYLYNNLKKPQRLQQLAMEFLKMAKWMHRHHISHGDLQHGNIIVNEDGKIKLIDYDSMFIPYVGFENKIEEIKGLPDYQHPCRMSNLKMTEKADYFSELVIYTSILALSKKASLWTKYDIDERDYSLLFDANDFTDYKNSKAFIDLKKLGKEFLPLLKVFESYLSLNDINDMMPFDKLIDKITKSPVVSDYKYYAPRGLYVGEKVHLSWKISYATTIELNGEILDSTTCEKELSKEGENIFSLKAYNDFKEITKTLIIEALPLPTILLEAEKTILHEGQNEKTTLKWDVSNAKKVYLTYDDHEEIIEPIGQMVFSPQTSMKYTINAIGLDGQRVFEKDVSINVCKEADVIFNCDCTEVIQKYPSILQWNVQNAYKVELKGYGKVESNASRKVIPKNTTVYTLIVTDAFGVKEYHCEVKTLSRPHIIFKTNKQKVNIDKNETATISWEIENASKAFLITDNERREISLKGDKKYKLKKKTKFELQVIGLDNKTVFKKVLVVEAFNHAKISFSADRKYTLPEIPVVLTWNVENAKKVQLSSFGKVKSKGTKTINIDKETTFILSVTDEFDTYEEKITVEMLPLPKVKSVNIPMPDFSRSVNINVNFPNFDTSIQLPNLTFTQMVFNIPQTDKLFQLLEMNNKSKDIFSLNEIKSYISINFRKLKNLWLKTIGLKNIL